MCKALGLIPSTAGKKGRKEGREEGKKKGRKGGRKEGNLLVSIITCQFLINKSIFLSI
jgi:hypothetical protein